MIVSSGSSFLGGGGELGPADHQGGAVGSWEAGGQAGRPHLDPPFTTPYIALQVTEEGCGELCDPSANCGHCDICHHTLTKEEEEEEEV